MENSSNNQQQPVMYEYLPATRRENIIGLLITLCGFLVIVFFCMWIGFSLGKNAERKKHYQKEMKELITKTRAYEKVF